MNPFRYPKARHRRGSDPGPFADHRAYKPYLRQEFSGQCVYCRMPDSLKGQEAFGVDHYQPKSRFSADAAAYSNLFYVCNVCNTWKGAFWPTRLQRDFGQFIPNPCDHTMFDHLRYQRWSVVPHSAAGEFTALVLDLNDEKVLQHRQFILEKIAQDLAARQELGQTMADIRAKLDRTPDDLEAMRLRNGMTKVAASLAKIERYLKMLAGEYCELPHFPESIR